VLRRAGAIAATLLVVASVLLGVHRMRQPEHTRPAAAEAVSLEEFRRAVREDVAGALAAARTASSAALSAGSRQLRLVAEARPRLPDLSREVETAVPGLVRRAQSAVEGLLETSEKALDSEENAR
jgi:hypothetical protein